MSDSKQSIIQSHEDRFNGPNLVVFDSTPYKMLGPIPMTIRYDALLIINVQDDKATKLKDSFGDVTKVGAIDHAMLYGLENNLVPELKRLQQPAHFNEEGKMTFPIFATNNTLKFRHRRVGLSLIRHEQVKQFGEPSNAEITELRRADEALELELSEVDIRIAQLEAEMKAMRLVREQTQLRFEKALAATRQAERMADHVELLEGDYTRYTSLTKTEFAQTEKFEP